MYISLTGVLTDFLWCTHKYSFKIKKNDPFFLILKFKIQLLYWDVALIMFMILYKADCLAVSLLSSRFISRNIEIICEEFTLSYLMNIAYQYMNLDFLLTIFKICVCPTINSSTYLRNENPDSTFDNIFFSLRV